MFIYYIRTAEFLISLLCLLESTRPIFTNLLAQMYSVLHPSAASAPPSETYIRKVLKYLVTTTNL